MINGQTYATKAELLTALDTLLSPLNYPLDVQVNFLQSYKDIVETVYDKLSEKLDTVAWEDITGSIANNADLTSGLATKVDNDRVLTDVPLGALFTDTVYDDTAVRALITINDGLIAALNSSVGDNTTDITNLQNENNVTGASFDNDERELTLTKKIGTEIVSIPDKIYEEVEEDWVAVASNEQNALLGLAYGNGVLISTAVNGVDRIMRSTDNGATWTSITSPVEIGFQKVIYCGNDTFVAIGDSGPTRSIRSTDLGLTWVDTGLTDDWTWRDLSIHEGVIIAVAYEANTTIAKSIDLGETWTVRTLGGGDDEGNVISYMRAVKGAQGKFIIVGEPAGGALISYDLGLTWEYFNLPLSTTYRSIGYGGGVFIALADPTAVNNIARSENGIDWEAITPPEIRSNREITYLNGVFKSVSLTGASRIFSSSDLGKTWVSESVPETNLFFSIIATDSHFVAASTDGTNRIMTKKVNKGEKYIRNVEGEREIIIDDSNPERIKVGIEPLKDADYSNIDVPSGRIREAFKSVDTQLTKLNNRIIVTQENVEETLLGTIDSTKEYFLDGVINLDGIGGLTKINVPSTGIYLTGYNFELSGLVCTEFNAIIFYGATAGNVLLNNFYISKTGQGTVFSLTDADGTHAIEMNYINFIDCYDLGALVGYRQGLEFGTGRFGENPSLTLAGNWSGGYTISKSIVRNMSDTTTDALFDAQVGNFSMSSRFYLNINADLGTLQPLVGFFPANFPNPSTLQLRDCIVTRDGSFVPEDNNLTPNITADSLSSDWEGNNGIPNTFVGAISNLTTEVETTIATVDIPVLLAGTFTATDLVHFDAPANGQLRHLGATPIEFKCNFDFLIEGTPANDYTISLVKLSNAVETTIYTQQRVINDLQGGRDVAYFTGSARSKLYQDDVVYWKVENNTGTGNCTLELGASWDIEAR